jgi:hypothetical protein
MGDGLEPASHFPSLDLIDSFLIKTLIYLVRLTAVIILLLAVCYFAAESLEHLFNYAILVCKKVHEIYTEIVLQLK